MLISLAATPAAISLPDLEAAVEDFRHEALHLAKAIRRSIATPLIRRYQNAAIAADLESQVGGRPIWVE